MEPVGVVRFIDYDDSPPGAKVCSSPVSTAAESVLNEQGVVARKLRSTLRFKDVVRLGVRDFGGVPYPGNLHPGPPVWGLPVCLGHLSYPSGPKDRYGRHRLRRAFNPMATREHFWVGPIEEAGLQMKVRFFQDEVARLPQNYLSLEQGRAGVEILLSKSCDVGGRSTGLVDLTFEVE